MLKKIFLPSILTVLAYGFWVSPNFKEIAAGIAIFLFGMISLEAGFKAFTGGALEKILKASTDKRWKSIGFGILTTSIMQSSSLVSVITISFLSAGLLGLAQGIGIIFGANVGTTTGAWLVAGLGLKVKISAYAMPMLVFGVILIFQKSKSLKGIGYVLSGLGFLFLGIHHMKEGFEAFKDTIDLAQFAVSGFSGLLLFTGLGIAATVIMQSSHATLVLIITALAAGQITYENALALAIGANIGTTITAIMGALGADIDGKRLAGAHLIFNVVTGLIAIIFIHQFLLAVDWTSSMMGIANDDYTLKLAVFHTLFNLCGVLVMLPFIDKMVVFLQRSFVSQERESLGPQYLHLASVDFPETAVEAIRKETLNIYDISFDLLADGISLDKKAIVGDTHLEQEVLSRHKVLDIDIDAEYERKIKGIYSAIIAFISKASFSWEVEQSASIHWLRSANQNIVEAIKDMKHLRKNMAKYMVSNNKYIRQQYDQLRVQIATVMREISRLRTQTESGKGDENIVLALDALKLLIMSKDKQVNQDIIMLIKNENITPAMGTSLMNDSRYAFNIANHLIAMGATLLAAYDEDKIRVEREVALDSLEIEQIAIADAK